MMRTFKSGLTIGMLVAALAMTGGCGDNDNSGNNNDNGGGARPTRTATPVAGKTSTPVAATATPTPVATSTPSGTTTVNVGFDVTSSAGVQGFDLRVAYPTAKGSFTGSGEDVACTTTAGGSFIKNDNDSSGTLTLIVANASNLTLPITISCTFDESSTLTPSDLTVTVREVTQNGAPGDVSVLTVTTSVS